MSSTDPYSGHRLEERLVGPVADMGVLRRLLKDIPDSYRVVIEDGESGAVYALATIIIDDTAKEVRL